MAGARRPSSLASDVIGADENTNRAMGFMPAAECVMHGLSGLIRKSGGAPQPIGVALGMRHCSIQFNP
jgi:hypothetical protein